MSLVGKLLNLFKAPAPKGGMTPEEADRICGAMFAIYDATPKNRNVPRRWRMANGYGYEELEPEVEPEVNSKLEGIALDKFNAQWDHRTSCDEPSGDFDLSHGFNPEPRRDPLLAVPIVRSDGTFVRFLTEEDIEIG